MARIQIKDLPEDSRITKEEMKKVFGGMTKTLYFGNITSYTPTDSLLSPAVVPDMDVNPDRETGTLLLKIDGGTNLIKL